jgi:hypothetical protein
VQFFNFKGISARVAATFLVIAGLGIIGSFMSPTQAAPPASTTPVTVVNTPLPVRSIDNAALQTLQGFVGLSLTNANTYVGSLSPLPAGKRFVLDYLDMRDSTPSGATPGYLVVTPSLNGSSASTFLMPLNFLPASTTFAQGTLQVPIYAEGFNGITFTYIPGYVPINTAEKSVNFIGHYVNFP